MDIVTITDTNLGLSDTPVRVISIEEDDKGLLAVTAEELVTGVSTPQYYPSASAGNFVPNMGVPAVPVNAPHIFEPPVAATGGVAQIWAGASGASYGSSTQWGGANVFVSVDDVTYSQFAVIAAPLNQGFLTTALPAAAGWDSTDTLAVSLAESGGALTGTTEAAALQGATLSLVDAELIAFETATLTGANAYALTGLARALSGTTPAYHSTGAPFARLDGAVIQYDVPANLAGQTLYFKFQSFNVFGGGLEDLSTCTVYPFTLASLGALDPIAAQLLSGIPLDLGQVIAPPTLSDDFGSVAVAASGFVDCGQVATSPHPIAAQLIGGSPLDLGATTAYPTLSDDFGSVADPVVDVISLGTVP